MSREKNDPSVPMKAADVDCWAEETDVIVVGLGAAGACAALEAAEAGGQVLVVEAASAGGGTTALSGGQIYLGGGTQTQRDCGFEDSPEAMEAYLRLAAGPGMDEDKVSLYARESLDHYAWLVDQGVVFNPEFYGGKHTNTPEYQSLAFSGNEKAYRESQLAPPAPRAHKPKAYWEEGGATLMATLIQRLDTLGIPVFTDTRALKLIVDDGRVVGLLCRRDGKPVAFRARRGVVLCSGGFVMNRDMLARYAPRLLDATPIGNPNDNGDGIQMGSGVGGATLNMHEGFLSMLWYPDGKFCEGVFVNRLGQRFINEDCYHSRGAHHALNQPGQKVYLVVDSAIFTGPPLYANPEVVEVGETFEELERDAGFPPDSLAVMLHTYNRNAAKGEDPAFHKGADFLRPLDQPPYALLDFSIDSGIYYPGFTFGGLATDVEGRVLRPSGRVVEGLFAAGRASAGLPRSGECYASGMSIGDATFFGRRAGRAAAASENAPVRASVQV